MTLARVLRIVAVVIAVAALLDPALATSREGLLRARIDLDRRDEDARAAADRLKAATLGTVEWVTAGPANAFVIVGGAGNFAPLPGGQPISTVTLGGNPDVSIASAPDTLSAPAGRPLDVVVGLRGRGMSGRTSAVMLAQDGADLARVEHRWDAAERVTVRLPYVVPGKAAVVSVRVEPGPDERRRSDNHVDIRVVPRSRPYEVAVLEPRPTWAAGFVRRALESDTAFHVSSLLQVSRGIAARAGDAPPPSLTGLDRFETMLVGAPEELTSAQVRSLDDFVRRRGGSVILVPDRAPSGPYTSFLPRGDRAWTEKLLEKPAALRPANVMASELVLLRPVDGQALEVLARTDAGETAIASWPLGAGRVIFSGALDAWRYRGQTAAAFTAFWTDIVSAAAGAAAPPLEVLLTPSVAAPGEAVTVTARRREVSASVGGDGAVPVTAELIDAAGAQQPIRLWPTSVAGAFSGSVSPRGEGRYDVRVSAAGDTADALLFVNEGARRPREGAEALRPLVDATGGVAVSADDLQPLVRHLASVARPHQPATWHPMRSAWWMVPFAAALAGEWVIRRRRGLH